MLARLQLRAEVKKEEPGDSGAQAGEVLKQSPLAGKAVAPGSVVTISIADVLPGNPIPSVVGKTRSEAEDVLRRLGYEVKFKDVKSDKVKIGLVVSQSPKAGARLERGQAVTLSVSSGRGQQKVPNLVELTPSVARQQLQKLGLDLIVLQVAQPGFRNGDPVRILRQEPDAGSKVKPGSKVTVFIPIPAPEPVGPGQPGQGTHAPRLEGRSVAEARKIASQNGVVLEFAESADDAAVITFQDPPPGDPLPGDGAVLVRTAVSAVVPGVTGMTESEARARIEKAQLIVGNVKRSHGPVSGEILGQVPSAGIEVFAGSTVDLVVADSSLAPDSALNTPPTPTPAFTPAPWVE